MRDLTEQALGTPLTVDAVPEFTPLIRPERAAESNGRASFSSQKIQDFLLHHGIAQNPFADEDAQSDTLFKDHCITVVFHPAWDKIFGNPANVSTSVVFGEKGSGKTALRLQMTEHLNRYNNEHPDGRVFVIEYDDFGKFLECFRAHSTGWGEQKPNVLAWNLFDHMDAILSLGVTQLVDAAIMRHEQNPLVNISKSSLASLSRTQKRDLLLLAAMYDRSTNMHLREGWNALRRRIGFRTWTAQKDKILGLLMTVCSIALLIGLPIGGKILRLPSWGAALMAVLGWLPYCRRWLKCQWQARRVGRALRVIRQDRNTLRKVLLRFPRTDLDDQPTPKNSESDRYPLLNKFQALIASLGFPSLLVLVDRIDEPHEIGGIPEKMRQFVWPMLDNKFLKQPASGIKLLLPIELEPFLARADRAFYERSRLDKQNLIRSLNWTGEALYDVASARLSCCRTPGDAVNKINLRDLIDQSVNDSDLVHALEKLRSPRHLFKFLHQLVIDHCNSFTSDHPQRKIKIETFRVTHATYLRSMKDAEQGLGTG